MNEMPMKENECAKGGVARQLRTEFLDRVAQNFDQDSCARICHAVEVAETAHAEQRRDDNTPYIVHPLRVAASLMQELHTYDGELICAALLHDVAEDQERYSVDCIEAEFGHRVSSIVRTLTKPDEPEMTRDEVNRIYFERLRHSDGDCRLIKLADKLDNVRDAVNCPNKAKQMRTVLEAKEFYLPLAAGLREEKQRRVMLKHMNEAIAALLRTIGKA